MTKRFDDREGMTARSTVIGWTLILGLIVSGAGPAYCQDYPNKLIRIVTAEAGTNADLLARLIAQGVSVALGQQVIVDNRRGNVINAAGAVSKAPPDGYNLLVYGPAVWTLSLIQEVPYDPVRDFSPIALAVSSIQMIVVHPSVPAKSVKDLIALARARPGRLNNSSSGFGSAVYFAAELFKSMAGVNIVRIEYKGAASALYALNAGEVDVMFPTADAASPYIRSSRLRALAVTSGRASALFPDLPPVSTSVPGYESVSALGVFAPAGTPPAIVNRLNQEIVRILNRMDVKNKFLSVGTEVVGSTPEEFAVKIASDIARLGKVIKRTGIKAD